MSELHTPFQRRQILCIYLLQYSHRDAIRPPFLFSWRSGLVPTHRGVKWLIPLGNVIHTEERSHEEINDRRTARARATDLAVIAGVTRRENGVGGGGCGCGHPCQQEYAHHILGAWTAKHNRVGAWSPHRRVFHKFLPQWLLYAHTETHTNTQTPSRSRRVTLCSASKSATRARIACWRGRRSPRDDHRTEVSSHRARRRSHACHSRPCAGVCIMTIAGVCWVRSGHAAPPPTPPWSRSTASWGPPCYRASDIGPRVRPLRALARSPRLRRGRRI